MASCGHPGLLAQTAIGLVKIELGWGILRKPGEGRRGRSDP